MHPFGIERIILDVLNDAVHSAVLMKSEEICKK